MSTQAYEPMTPEQRRRWRESGLFPVERWSTAPDATPLVCPMPDRAQLRELAEAIPPHIQASGWYATRQRYEQRSVYADSFRGMGRQAIASVISVGKYSGPLADYIAAASPRAVLALTDYIATVEQRALTLRVATLALLDVLERMEALPESTRPTEHDYWKAMQTAAAAAASLGVSQ